jgi:hypothetical protein
VSFVLFLLYVAVWTGGLAVDAIFAAEVLPRIIP